MAKTQGQVSGNGNASDLRTAGAEASLVPPEGAPRLKLTSLELPSSAHLVLAKSLFQKGRHSQALTELDAALAENSERGAAHFLKGMILARRSDFAGAAKSLAFAVRLEPTEATYWTALAAVRLELGQYNPALAAVEESLKRDPKQPNAHFLRGNIFAALKRRDDAIAAYRNALSFNPQFTNARYKLGYLLAQAGRTDEAIQETIIAHRFNPMNMNSRVSLGDMLRKLGKYDAALREYKAAADLPPGQATPYSKLGETYFELGQIMEAMTCFRTAIRLDPKAVWCHIHLGRIYLEQQRYGEAEEMFRAAAKIDPNLPVAAELLKEAVAAVQRTARMAARRLLQPPSMTAFRTQILRFGSMLYPP